MNTKKIVNDVIMSNAFRCKDLINAMEWDVIQSFYSVTEPFHVGFALWKDEEVTLLRTKDSDDEHDGYDKAFEMTKTASQHAKNNDRMVDFGKAMVDHERGVIERKRIDIRKSGKRVR